ncbi:Protein of unknown function [Hydrobacter penzbergensis]|uniref:DUF3810 domain-containing protein n=1 Tax=Hydrobacter penzbergensis TaxID=1235997 RepID=A0A8X8ICC0_9BACT|nr:DUF3810 domain-containing protein [Hydrobacter penzbergensis]SDW06707.1 Protein of unknown function [Hydrobacter penzbergensis]
MKPGTKITRSLFPATILRLLLALGLLVVSFFPQFVEYWYSQGIYPAIGSTLRLLTRWIPFSIGDVGYLLLACWLFVRLVQWLMRLKREGLSKALMLQGLLSFIHFLLGIYIVFKLVWGFNYNRLGIAYQLKLEKLPYSQQALNQLTSDLIDSANTYRRRFDTILPAPSIDSIYRDAYHAYLQASDAYPFLDYHQRSVKASLYTPVADYIGFTGYYNPFSGEAQLRTDVPRILLPYVACHEMAHQLGYASESEANFVGFLAAANSANPYFRYSVYLDLFSYAQGEQLAQYAMDKDAQGFEAAIQHNRNQLDTLVKKDRREIREFFRKRSNRISPAMNSLYDQYLKMNSQEKGMKSYDEVIGWILAYRKKGVGS